MKKEVLWKL